MIEVMSQPELRRWLRRYVKPGMGSRVGNVRGELPTLALIRQIGWSHTQFYDWLVGNYPMPDEKQRALSRFCRAWDAGVMDVKKVGARRELVRRTTPKHMPAQLSVEIGGRYPKLTVIGRGRAPGI